MHIPRCLYFCLEVEQPANAYDSVVAMLQSWLVGGKHF